MNPKTKPREKHAFVGIHHACCNAYSRAYINALCDAFEGSCGPQSDDHVLERRRVARRQS